MWVFGKYLLVQAPGWFVVAGFLWVVAALFEFSTSIVWALVGCNVVKDLALYPWLRPAYEDRPSRFVGADALVGAVGRVDQRLAPHGHVRIGAERWRAVTETADEPLEVGCIVRVRAVSGLELTVEAVSAGN